MFKHNLNIGGFPQTSQLKEQLSLLQKKDQQIRRLQSQLDEERRRADNAVKMLQNYKAIQNKYDEGSEGLRNQITRRIKAEQQLKKVQQRNKMLEDGIKEYMRKLKDNKTSIVFQQNQIQEQCI